MRSAIAHLGCPTHVWQTKSGYPSRASAGTTLADTDRMALAADRRVLVVDDDSRPRRATARVLQRRLACEVVHASGALRALAIVRRERIDAVVTDIEMPEMDGFEFLEHLETEFPELPVIVWTGSDRADQLAEGRVSFVLRKTEPIADLVDGISILLR